MFKPKKQLGKFLPQLKNALGRAKGVCSYDDMRMIKPVLGEYASYQQDVDKFLPPNWRQREEPLRKKLVEENNYGVYINYLPSGGRLSESCPDTHGAVMRVLDGSICTVACRGKREKWFSVHHKGETIMIPPVMNVNYMVGNDGNTSHGLFLSVSKSEKNGGK